MNYTSLLSLNDIYSLKMFRNYILSRFSVELQIFKSNALLKLKYCVDSNFARDLELDLLVKTFFKRVCSSEFVL